MRTIYLSLFVLSLGAQTANAYPLSIDVSGKIQLDQSIKFLVRKAYTNEKYTWKPILRGELHMDLKFNHQSDSRYEYLLPQDATFAILYIHSNRMPEQRFDIYPMAGIRQLPCLKPDFQRVENQFSFGVIVWTPLPAGYEAPYTVFHTGRKWIPAQIVINNDLNQSVNPDVDSFASRVSQAFSTTHANGAGYVYAPLGKGELTVRCLMEVITAPQPD